MIYACRPWSPVVRFTEQADREGGPTTRLLATLVEHKLADRVT